MKRCLIILLAICAIACHNNPAPAPDAPDRVWLSPSNQYFDMAHAESVPKEVASDTVDWGAEVDVTRHWYPESHIVHLFGKPSRMQVAKWKDACDRDTLHLVDNMELSRFKYGIRHITAFYDLNNLSFGDDQEDAFILWRLAQFTGDSVAPASVGARLELFHEQIDKLLEFDAQFQVELNMKACMEGYLQHRYNRIAAREIAQEREAVARYIAQDYSLAEKYSESYSEAFEIVNYYSAGMGSSYPVTYGESETNDATMIRCAVNAWVYPDSTGLIGIDSRYATIDRVLAEYDAFADGLEEDEYCLPVDQRRAALDKEKAAWKNWMDYRSEVSPLLHEPLRSAFDHATRSICRRKLITLKNRYDSFGYMSADFEASLLSYDCTDEQLKTYQYPM